ncbi:MAG: metallophosphoesterase family protein [Candidatus Bipolaricaulota bacterium]|nr:metallophosphoesterase family protein [Candidatus Bipolaricaulota bacterium]
MREPVAILSDVHGNVRALDCVLDDIARRGIHRPFDPRPAADRLMGLDIPTVPGNEDRVLLDAGFPLSRAGGRPLTRTARFTRERLEPRHLAWIASLPLTTTVEDALLCHGTPTDDTVYLLSRVSAGVLALRTGEELDSLLDAVVERLVFCGHDHTQRLAVRGEKLIVNPGSVGCPAYADDVPETHVVESGSPHARFAIVRSSAGGAHSVEWVAVSYDAEAAADEALANGFPEWASWIATGRAK